MEIENEEELKCLGFRPQHRIGECAGCEMVCEECELLMIVEEIEDYTINLIMKNDNKKCLVKICRDKGIVKSRWCRYKNLEGQPESKVVNKNTLKLNIFRWYVGREPSIDEQIRMNMTGLGAVDYFIKK